MIGPNYHQRCCTRRPYGPLCSCGSNEIRMRICGGTIPAGRAFVDMRRSRTAARAQCKAWALPGLVDHLMLRSRLVIVLHSSPAIVPDPCLDGGGDRGHGHGGVPLAGWSQEGVEGGRHLGACKVASMIYHRGGDGRDLGHVSARRDTGPSCRRRDGTVPPLWNAPCRNSYHEGID